MKCPICKHGETQPGMATVTLERDGAAVIFRQVPAQICGNCGETYHDEEVTRELLKQAGAAISAGVEVDIRKFRKVA